MEKTLNFIIATRKAFIRLIDSLTVDQLNEIPAGFNNNIIWNFGHIVVATQGLCYLRTGVSTDSAAVKYLNKYSKGTKPTEPVSAEEINDLKQLAIETIEKIEMDYNNGLFQSITPFATDTYLDTLHTIEDVITLTSGHDNLHYGYALAQKRVINK